MLVFSAFEIIMHFAPLIWVVENPATRAAEVPPVYGALALAGRDLL